MARAMNLKEVERRAFTSYYRDGIWDMYLGFLIMIMPLGEVLSYIGVSKTVGLIVYLCLTIGALTSFLLLKKKVTVPRLGNVDFNQQRKKKYTLLKYILSFTALLGVIVFVLTIVSWRYQIPVFTNILSSNTLLGICVGVFFVVVFSIIAFLMDFTRAYFMGLLFGTGIASAMILDTAVFMVLGGLVFVILGSVLFIRFLKENPLLSDESGINGAIPNGKY